MSVKCTVNRKIKHLTFRLTFESHVVVFEGTKTKNNSQILGIFDLNHKIF